MMKVYNLENIQSVAILKRLVKAIQPDERSIIVVDTFPGIAKRLQNISISLFHMDAEKTMEQLENLGDYCSDWLDNLLPFGALRTEANKKLKEHIDQIACLCDEAPNLIDDHEIMAHGGMISSIILSYYLTECKKMNSVLDSCHFMRLGSDRKPDMEYIKKDVEELMKDCPDVPILITQSRLCKNVYNETDFFPQGGNEYYATVIGAVFHANEVVSALHSNDICFHGIEETRTLTFGEAQNFVDSGIKLVPPPCLSLARSTGMSIVLMKAPDMTEEQLRISTEKTGQEIKAVASRKGVVYIKLRSLGVLTSYLFIGKISDIFEKYMVPVYLMTSSNVSISLAVECSKDTLRLMHRELRKYAEIGVEAEMSVISIIGNLKWEHAGLESKIIETFKEMPIYMISYGSSNHNVSILVREQDREKALVSLANVFLKIPLNTVDALSPYSSLQSSLII